MTGGFLIQYANRATTPEYRVATFVAGEPRLTWVSLFFDNFPQADVYLVGGTLRDVLLGMIPTDIDIVVRNVPLKKLQGWLMSHGAADFVGKRFGTFKFAPHGTAGQLPLDIAHPRKEFLSPVHKSGRSSMEVEYDSHLPIKKDLARRDFTINAMAYDIRTGHLIDPYDGLVDLQSGLICAVLNPAQRFFEDATRMLRGLRFASQLGFSIEADTWEALKNNLPLLNNTDITDEGTHAYVVPREAIGKEFLLGYNAHPTHTLELWKHAGALEMFMPAIADLENIVLRDGSSAWTKTLQVLHLLNKPSLLFEHGLEKPSPTALVAALSSFVDGNASKLAFDVCKKLYFHQFPSGHRAEVDCKNVLWILDHLYDFDEINPASMRPSVFEKMFCSMRGSDLLLLMHAVFIASGSHSLSRERLHVALRIANKMCHFEGGHARATKLISGADISALGVPTGPVYRDLMEQVRDAQLAGKISNKKEALELLRDLISK
ncbi:MAG: hypothetical protein ABIA47_02720 [bacterium]